MFKERAAPPGLSCVAGRVWGEGGARRAIKGGAGRPPAAAAPTWRKARSAARRARSKTPCAGARNAPRTHNTRSGNAHYLADDEDDAIDYVRALLAYLPSNNLDEPPTFDQTAELGPSEADRALDVLIPDSANQPYDIRTVVETVVEDFLEVQPLYAQNIDIYVAPTWDSGETWLATMQHIAREGGCWVVGCATALEASDIPDGVPYRDELFPNKDEWINAGDAVVYKPFGGVVAGPMHRQKGLLFAEIDVAAARASRRKFDASGHYARPDVFTLTVNRKKQAPVHFT